MNNMLRRYVTVAAAVSAALILVSCTPAPPAPEEFNCETAGGAIAEGSEACWFAGGGGESCDQICAYKGLTYDDRTAGFAGSEGTNENCLAVLDALQLGEGDVYNQSGGGFGCINVPTTGRFRDPTTTVAYLSNIKAERSCACKELEQETP